jgi:hypothetical protein
MAFNRVNKLKQYKLVIDIVNQHFVEGLTPYAAVWRLYVNPVYPMSYNKFMQIINMPAIEKQLAEAEEEQRIRRESKEQLPGQLYLFEDQ